ncbi:APH(3') family aminoglycoside O-phosphotransferase [Sinorhizobium sp. A49]|uniref:APH(3') family aminoglycoside O-phosphotransferase n=1 Tax=Sinorhizobium sp. A49 TaxID=1945861 RepID=UPI00098586C5|nr:APH(3') family aminoglycoside O-phosphotransferase [Sinorhizobium sp. A49]OOG70053.1 APH(3') family aminoglycoside O-phosphotransferase [Sinorhizobium sp. A49]
MSLQFPDIDLPPGFAPLLKGYSWRKDSLGQSASSVFLFDAEARTPLVLKVEPSGPFDELVDEAERLEWLGKQGMPCPRVIARDEYARRNWLLMEAVDGVDLASSSLAASEQVVLLAEAVRRMHALDVEACPFDHRVDARVAIARLRAEADLIDVTDFDKERLGKTAEELFVELQAKIPQEEKLVVTHGDACLPNIIVRDGRFAGFIDCSRLGVADPYQDLALTCRSIAYNLGEEWVQPFLDLYGVRRADPDRLDFYCLLDEFF